MKNEHPDSPRPDGAEDDEVNDVTRQQQGNLGHPRIAQELGRDHELAEEAPAGQNSDWLPQ